MELSELRRANVLRDEELRFRMQLRNPEFRRFSLAFRGLELAGEVGELCNLLKKLDRANQGFGEKPLNIESMIEEEIGDVQITLDLLAMDLGMSLDVPTALKFNRSSTKMGLSTKIFFPDQKAIRKENWKQLLRDLNERD